MAAFLLSHDDNNNDMIITLLLLVACDLAINKTASFHERLTVDEIRRRSSSKIWHRALQHSLSSPFWTLFNSKHDDALITLCVFDHASFELLHQRFKAYFDSFTPCKNGIYCQEFNSKFRWAYTVVFHQLSGSWACMD